MTLLFVPMFAPDEADTGVATPTTTSPTMAAPAASIRAAAAEAEVEAKDHLGTRSSTNWQVIEKMNETTLAACTNAKSGRKILINTVAFLIRDQAMPKMLEDCATHPEMAFRSDSNGELITTFRQIAQEISMLRLAT